MRQLQNAAQREPLAFPGNEGLPDAAFGPLPAVSRLKWWGWL
jgi:hypothetical protein